MPVIDEQRALRILGGQEAGPLASCLRAMAAAGEPFYAGAMCLRNWMYDRRLLASRELPRPVLSVGNVTTGGTGKTPVVAWLARQFLGAGVLPAVLLRGYRATRGGASGAADEMVSDEADLLRSLLPEAIIALGADRVASAAGALAGRPDIGVFILDDGMQHRRVRRGFEVVLIDAAAPFGFGHVLPRGLLREPIAGLRRAGAFLVTHASEVDASRISEIEATLARCNPAASVFRCDHRIRGLIDADDVPHPLELLAGRKYFVACGIGNPAAFTGALATIAGDAVGRRWFADHHAFVDRDLVDLRKEAAEAGAGCVVVTEKDWVKLKKLPGASSAAPPLVRARLEIAFRQDDGELLFRQIHSALVPRTTIAV